METQITPEWLATADGRKAERILRSCVHCGFCTATCPTYQLMGDELDGPRGRIYLIKGLLEGDKATTLVQSHLDRCLTCRACETTCPSGVRYSQLLHIGRSIVDAAGLRSPGQRLLRWALRNTLAYPNRLAPLLALGRMFRPLLPGSLRAQIPRAAPRPSPPSSQHQRRVVLFQGCAQSVMAAGINQAAERVLHKLGISSIRIAAERCCGAVNHHLGDQVTAAGMARNNIDLWRQALDQGAEAIVFTASACLLEVKEYSLLLEDDPSYQEKLQNLQGRCLELAEFLAREDLETLKRDLPEGSVAFHAPCTLQHGLQQPDTISKLLEKLGFDVRLPENGHLCCGSAGTYSILQPALSGRLRSNKLASLNATGATTFATANIGCLLHLAAGSDRPVVHWVELL